MTTETLKGIVLLKGPLDMMCRETNLLKKQEKVFDQEKGQYHIYEKTGAVYDGWSIYEFQETVDR